MHWFIGIVLGLITGYAFWPQKPGSMVAVAIIAGFMVLIAALVFSRRVGLVPGFWVGIVAGVFFGLCFGKLIIGVIVTDVVFLGLLVFTKNSVLTTVMPRPPVNRP